MTRYLENCEDFGEEKDKVFQWMENYMDEATPEELSAMACKHFELWNADGKIPDWLMDLADDVFSDNYVGF